MIQIQCTACGTRLSVRFSYSTNFGISVQLPAGWQMKTDSQQLFCSEQCAIEQGRKEMPQLPHVIFL